MLLHIICNPHETYLFVNSQSSQTKIRENCKKFLITSSSQTQVHLHPKHKIRGRKRVRFLRRLQEPFPLHLQNTQRANNLLRKTDFLQVRQHGTSLPYLHRLLFNATQLPNPTPPLRKHAFPAQLKANLSPTLHLPHPPANFPQFPPPHPLTQKAHFLPKYGGK